MTSKSSFPDKTNKQKKRSCAVPYVLSPASLGDRQTDGFGQTDGGWGGVDGPPQLKPGQQRTRVMLVHSSPTARLDGGKDGEGECGSRGAEVGQSAGVWRVGRGASGGVVRGIRGEKESDQVHKFGCGAACVCVLNLEPDGAAAGPEVMRSQQGKMGKDDQWENNLPTPQLL